MRFWSFFSGIFLSLCSELIYLKLKKRVSNIPALCWLINIENIFQYLTKVLKRVGQCTCLPNLELMLVGVCFVVEDGLDSLVFVVVVECSVVLFFIGKSQYAGFSLSMETVFSLPFMVSVKYLKSLSITWNGQE